MPSLINNNQYKLPLISNKSNYKKIHEYIFTHPGKNVNTYSFRHNPKATWNNNSDTAFYWTPHIDGDINQTAPYTKPVSPENPTPSFHNIPQYFKQHEPRLEYLLNYTELIPTQLPPTHWLLIHRENLRRAAKQAPLLHLPQPKGDSVPLSNNPYYTNTL